MSNTVVADSVRTPVNSERLRSLDGLRGVAALIVVLHHCMLTYVPFAATYEVGTAGASIGSNLWWATQTPFKLLTAGGEAVTIFFVLSGVVLTVPVLKAAQFDWWGYYPRRMVRLYVPVIAAVIFAGILTWIIPNGPTAQASWWTQGSTIKHASAGVVLSAMDLLGGFGSIDNPLWSLKWEVLFSLALPAIIAIALLAKRRPWIPVLAAAAGIAIGVELGDASLTYLPVFVGGAVIAVSLPALRTWTEKFENRPGAQVWWVLIFIAAVLALIAYWLVRPFVDDHQFFAAFLRALSMLGAMAIVILAAFWKAAKRLLETPIIQWLGRVSFSLYLIHVPILITLNSFLGPKLWWLSALCTIALALGAAELFSRFVEQPAHRLSQRTGRFFSSVVARETDPQA